MTKRVIIELPAVGHASRDRLCRIPLFAGARATGKRVYATTLADDVKVAQAVHEILPDLREISIDGRPVWLYNGIEGDPAADQQFTITVREHGKRGKKDILENIEVVGELAKREAVSALDLQYPPETHEIRVTKR